ncbi:MAG: hypothetical protein K6F76_00270 [Clostridiales bacterium]|nr:hypothetical protein [Clostridiales bacterium]
MTTKRTIRIQTHTGIKSLKLEIDFDSEDIDEITQMTIKTHYQGKEIIAFGSRYPFEDAFANLQNKLPESVTLTGCVTCRHGNLCPVGNYPNELYCTKDVSINCKSDLYFYTENEGECKKRSRQFTDYCDDFKKQEESVFTYNDYLYYLSDKSR